jgi:hypothetical protein
VRLTNRRPLSVVPDRVDDARRTTTIRRSAAAQEWLVQPGASAAWRTSRVCAPSPPPCAVEGWRREHLASAPRLGAAREQAQPRAAQLLPPRHSVRCRCRRRRPRTARPLAPTTRLRGVLLVTQPRYHGLHGPRTHTQAVQTKPQAQRMRREIVTTGVATRTTGRRETNRTPTRKLFWFFFFFA